MLFLARCAAVSSYLIAILYSTVFLKKNRRPTYFKCAFYATLPLCLSGFYSLALTTIDTAPTDFSLGILGELSAYLFITAANTSLIPREPSEKKRRLCVPALICTLLLLAILLVPAVAVRSIPSHITAVLYAVSMCPCMYSCVDVCRNRFRNPFKAGVRGYNRLVIVHLIGTALFPLVPCGVCGAYESIVTALCAAAWTVSGLLGMLLLKKGLAPWEI